VREGNVGFLSANVLAHEKVLYRTRHMAVAATSPHIAEEASRRST
jgi:hypothetical protein